LTRSFLLKLSGEALAASEQDIISPSMLKAYSDEIECAINNNVGIAVVVGGGNYFRGASLQSSGIERVIADKMGMLATLMNGLALTDFMRQKGVDVEIYHSSSIDGVVGPYNRDLARARLDAGEVVVLTGGTGNPFFTTDTAACLRAIELGVEAVLKATSVDGVYSADPTKNKDAYRYETLGISEILEKELGVIDMTAAVLCKENNMPLQVVDSRTPGWMLKVIDGDPVGTIVHPNE
jgi:uridylate kinase